MRHLFFITFILQTSLSQDLIINESMSKNNNAVYDEDGDTFDWIEIYNNSLNPINMGDYYLTDDSSDLGKWKFPGGAYGSSQMKIKLN